MRSASSCALHRTIDGRARDTHKSSHFRSCVFSSPHESDEMSFLCGGELRLNRPRFSAATLWVRALG